MSLKIFPYQLKSQVRDIKKHYFFPSLKLLRGNVLEIGFGKGENFKHFRDCTVYAIERQNKFREKVKNIPNCNLFIQVGRAEQMPFKYSCFDAVVFSFVLCSVDSVENTIQEITRVLKKGGKIILLEHIKSSHWFILFIQEILTKIQCLFSNCHLNRDPRILLKEYKFQIIKENSFSNLLEPYIYLEAIKQ